MAPRRPCRNRQVPRRLQDGIILELIVNRDIKSTSSEFEVAVYFPILDLMISEMHKRFDNKNIALMKAVNSCNLTSLSFLETEKVLPKAEANNFFDKTLLRKECTLVSRTLKQWIILKKDSWRALRVSLNMVIYETVKTVTG